MPSTTISEAIDRHAAIRIKLVLKHIAEYQIFRRIFRIENGHRPGQFDSFRIAEQGIGTQHAQDAHVAGPAREIAFLDTPQNDDPRAR